MASKCDKADAKKLKLLKGVHKRDTYDDAKWRKRPIDLDGEQYSGSLFSNKRNGMKIS